MSKERQPFSATSLLPPEEQEAIRAKARETIRAEQMEAASKAFLEQALKEERAKVNINARNEELVQVLIDLPGFAGSIKIDNREYFHGTTVTVPVSVARDMQSMMARSWEHEAEVGGANRDAYRQPKHTAIRPGSH